MDKEQTKTTTIQLLKYGVIGASNTVITLAVFYVFNTLIGIPYGAANVIGYVLGVINSFVWNKNWVFNKKKSNWKREALLFGCGFLLCFGLQLLVGWYLLTFTPLNDLELDWLPMKKTGENVVMCLSMIVYTLANYTYNRFVTFK